MELQLGYRVKRRSMYLGPDLGYAVVVLLLVRCKMKRSDLKNDTMHAIYGSWEEVSRVCNSDEVVFEISRNLMKCTY